MVTVDRVIGEDKTSFQKVLVSENGLVRMEFFGRDLAHPWVMLKLPSKAGDTWADDDPEEVGSNTVREIEKVKVPAGTFDVVRVDSEYTRGKKSENMKNSFWYARGVGVVKSTGRGYTWVLKSFTPGKE